MSQSIKLRDLQAGARINRNGITTVVSSVDWSDSLISVDNGKVARALRVCCDGQEPFLGHPGEDITIEMSH
jgi:hypothetical protein